MDVALDANIYVADPRMEGVAFRSLLDYLRKTQSSLVIPRLVLDEVLARSSERLLEQTKRASSHVDSLRSLVLVAAIRKVPFIDVARESRALRLKMTKPSKYVKAILLGDFRRINIEEVAKRGVERIPPADQNGEELRDVITWLMILRYAEQSKGEVAFITADKHFGRDNTLLPPLAKEVQEKKVRLLYYGTVDDFIKAHAPTPREIVADLVFSYIGKQHILDRFEIAARSFFPRDWRIATSVDVISRDITFTRGALYGIGEGSEYGEMQFSGEMKLRVTTQKSSFYSNLAGGFASNLPIADSLNNGAWLGSPVWETYGSVVGQSSPVRWFGDSGPVYLIGASKAPTFTPRASMPYTLPIENAVVSEFSLTGKLTVSMRLVSSKVTHVDTEKFELVAISRMS